MEQVLDFNAVLQDFQYKPNFAVKAFKQNDEWWIRVVMLVEDARKPFKPWTLEQRPHQNEYYRSYDLLYRPPVSNLIGYSPSRELIEVLGTFPIPDFLHDDLIFIEWLVQIIRQMEDHETFEWLRYKGELINDPHKVK